MTTQAQATTTSAAADQPLEKSRSTRRNHIGQYTTTVVLSDSTGRLYGHGKTSQAANASADNKLAAYAVTRLAYR